MHYSYNINTAKKGRGLSSLLISKVSKENNGKKKRKFNDGEFEEDAKNSESEREEEDEGEVHHDEMADEVSQN